jgi:hypothetical protein
MFVVICTFNFPFSLGATERPTLFGLFDHGPGIYCSSVLKLQNAPLNSFGVQHLMGDPKYCLVESATEKKASINDVQ